LASAARCRELTWFVRAIAGVASRAAAISAPTEVWIWSFRSPSGRPITRVCLITRRAFEPRCYGTRQPILEHDHASTRLPADRFRLKAARERKRLTTGKCEGRKSHAEMSPEMVRIAKGLRRRKRGKFTGADRRCCWRAGGPKYPPPVRSIFEQSKQQRRLSRCSRLGGSAATCSIR
jgi:hypothetical protein